MAMQVEELAELADGQTGCALVSSGCLRGTSLLQGQVYFRRRKEGLQRAERCTSYSLLLCRLKNPPAENMHCILKPLVKSRCQSNHQTCRLS